jgi:hypothetical protein
LKKVVDYLNCHIVESEKEKKIVMVQPHLINRLIQQFEKEKIGKRFYEFPGTPRFKIHRTTKDMEALDTDQQKKYRSGVGMLLYLTKYLRPDISNVVREFSKCMDGATWAAYHEMLHVI